MRRKIKMSKAEDILSKYDFSGWATRTNLRCSDGRTIMENAFAHNDGQIVPLVWMHDHGDPSKVLGHGLLKNEKEGVRIYGVFNNTEAGQNAKKLVHAGDVTDLSIYANQLQQKTIGDGVGVFHGDIKEVSLVLAGANPGAHIDSEIVHGDYSEEAAFICTGEGISLSHAEEKKEDVKEEEKKEENEDETIADVFETLTDKQKKAVYAIVGAALEDNDDSDNDNSNDSEGGNESMKHNAFEGDNTQRSNVLSHSDMETILNQAKRNGDSLKNTYEDYISNMNLAHADNEEEEHVPATYGIDYIDYLFPEHKALNGGAPEFIKRDTGWVSKVMAGVHHSPFAKIKSVFADIREDEARAKGYIKGNAKKDEVFSLLKRKTGPTTVYKKQKFDRDDIIDITDFDAVAWVKAEMRMMLDEEFARAYLFGDGRLGSSDDKIDETSIRPAISDDQLYTIQVEIEGSDDTEKANDMVDKVVIGQDTYQGSGNLTAFIKQSWVTKMLLLRDEIGHRLYKNMAELATAMSVDSIVKVPDSIVPTGYYGVVLDLKDYNVGADKGGAVSLFDDFDIDYNQQKYLIEARCSGALTKPFSAIALKVAA
jgi:HK97 family phage prohead protease